MRRLIEVVLLITSLSACQSGSANTLSPLPNKGEIMANSPIIIAHRGASGFLPEHSKEAAVLAFMQDADYIEQDLVVSKDDHLVILHDIHLETVTNVEALFPERVRADNRYYAIDFTLLELRQLSLHERQTSEGMMVFPRRYTGNAHFSITTFAEQVELVQELNRQFAKNVGWYPEIKSPQWHIKEGKDIAKLFSAELNRLGLNTTTTKIYVQSFEPNSLKRLKQEFGLKVPLIQLIADNSWEESDADYDVMLTAAGLEDIATYAQGIGPWLPQVYDYKNNQISDLLSLAKQQKLQVHPYTHREDAQDLPDSPKIMFNMLKKAGIDGIFTDQIMPYMVD
ncbi:MAG: glycerophosphoryl diester phosphodiesterase [Alphaproteobacteria bacterium]|jgi:glycerophosphoryl diester phosphodiesterase